MRLRAAMLWAAVGYVAGLLLAPASLVLALLLTGATCLVVGVHALAGPGWAMITGGCIAFALAAILARGATRG